jgi:hypothetical protein
MGPSVQRRKQELSAPRERIYNSGASRAPLIVAGKNDLRSSVGGACGRDRERRPELPAVAVRRPPSRTRRSVDAVRQRDGRGDGHTGVSAPCRAGRGRHDVDRPRLPGVSLYHRDVDSAGARRAVAGRQRTHSSRSSRRRSQRITHRHRRLDGQRRTGERARMAIARSSGRRRPGASGAGGRS